MKKIIRIFVSTLYISFWNSGWIGYVSESYKLPIYFKELKETSVLKSFTQE